MKKLSIKEQAFVTAFLGKARGNITEAAKLAGYGKNRTTNSALGSRLLGKVWIQRAITERTEKAERKAVLDADARDALLSTIASDPHEETRDRLSAVKELNKVTGRHSVNVAVTGRVTLEQILGESRK